MPSTEYDKRACGGAVTTAQLMTLAPVVLNYAPHHSPQIMRRRPAARGPTSMFGIVTLAKTRVNYIVH